MGSNECGGATTRRVREVVVCVCENVCVCVLGIVFSADTHESYMRVGPCVASRRRIVDVYAGDALDVSRHAIERRFAPPAMRPTHGHHRSLCEHSSPKPMGEDADATVASR